MDPLRSLESHLAAIDLLEAQDGAADVVAIPSYGMRRSISLLIPDRPLKSLGLQAARFWDETSGSKEDALLWPSTPIVTRDDRTDSLVGAQVQPLQAMASDSDEAKAFSGLLTSTSATLGAESARLFARLQQRLLEQHAAEVVRLNATHRHELDAQRRSVHAVSSKQQRLQTIAARQEAILLRVADALQRRTLDTRRRWSSAYSAGRCLHAWTQYMLARRQKRQHLRRALSLYISRLPRRPFQHWRSYIRAQAQSRSAQTQSSAHAQEIYALQDAHTAELHELRDQLHRAQIDMDAYALEKTRLEEDVRRVFLRGVSAMNLEALSLFRSRPRDEMALDADDSEPRPSHAIPTPLYSTRS
ncbi:hypothetical protein SDRG_02308 [Saprolegnia diclina VS20]|uniref:Centrosomal protein POC5 n=1 Tax=Saprolegnia diclina (strain VS20) TaxID=1156394 RepID=T0R0D7_SAPDV|nr:hypothetical protein SDRG_02308 [Saprolegnia diclina VS20]EQC40411.1 hypothetical protein SDRG_02308 [Saprolegnia diclina VS20]|eukprot:XP_008606110.1 hypothetical protein SDRG_02308 [Saprolegnia diclina VS20]